MTGKSLSAWACDGVPLRPERLMPGGLDSQSHRIGAGDRKNTIGI